MRNGKVYAFDEDHAPWTLDPVTLESIATDNIGVSDPELKAHFRMDAQTGERVLFDTLFGPDSPSHSAHIVSADGRTTTRRTIALGADVPLTYIHDFFVTASSVMFHLQPAFPDFAKLSQGVAFARSLDWKSEQGTKLAILSRAGDVDPFIVETDSRWMWHSVNA